MIKTSNNNITIKKMKKLILSAAFLTVGTFAMAQQNTPSLQKNPAQMEQKRAEKMKQMQTDLNLNADQVTKIQALHDRKMADRKANEPQMKAERQAKIDAMKAKKEQYKAEMKQILTPEQYQKWEASKKDKMRMNKGKMQNRQNLKSGAK